MMNIFFLLTSAFNPMEDPKLSDFNLAYTDLSPYFVNMNDINSQLYNTGFNYPPLDKLLLKAMYLIEENTNLRFRRVKHFLGRPLIINYTKYTSSVAVNPNSRKVSVNFMDFKIISNFLLQSLGWFKSLGVGDSKWPKDTRSIAYFPEGYQPNLFKDDSLKDLENMFSAHDWYAINNIFVGQKFSLNPFCENLTIEKSFLFDVSPNYLVYNPARSLEKYADFKLIIQASLERFKKHISRFDIYYWDNFLEVIEGDCFKRKPKSQFKKCVCGLLQDEDIGQHNLFEQCMKHTDKWDD